MSLVKSLAQMARSSEDIKTAQFSIYDYDEAGTKPASASNGMSLQYYPESFSLDRSVDYSSKKPIGGSHPLYQWIHGGERVLSFDAVFTAEVDLWGSGNPDAVSSVEQLATSVGDFIKNPIAAAINNVTQSPLDLGRNHVDVANGVAWLQSKTYPSYASVDGVKPPPKLMLHIPNAGITTFVKGMTISDVFYCIMTRCNVKITSLFRSGAPRVAEVSMSFDEIVQIGKNWGFVSRETFVYNQAVATANASGPFSAIAPPDNNKGYSKIPNDALVTQRKPNNSVTPNDVSIPNQIRKLLGK